MATSMVRYVYGKEVEATVGLDVGVRKTGNISEPDRGRSVTMARQQLKNGKASFVVELDKLNNDQEAFAVENAVLVLTSTVVESATGKEESSSDHSVTFVKYPFKFDLSRSKKTYRSGVPYFLQVDMLYPNGTPAKRYDFILEVYNGGQLASNTSHITNKKGQCVYLIAPVFEEMDRMLKLYVRGFEEFAIEYQLKHDSRKKPLIVEQVQEVITFSSL
ncbi:complement C4-B-like [Dreissena polymorpha]|uniref:complement C4-B-like n=1 Tax=Dreissena polymorpha TaxID=45954 RepID=UPI00226408EE|nr:complement C4-B-like [Dreissena polymorpha]